MKKRVFPVLGILALMSLNANAQFGFGGQQIEAKDMHCSEKFADLNYAGDELSQHTLDVYRPEKKTDKYPVIVPIYGSAWFSNNSKGMADINTICARLLDAGIPVGLESLPPTCWSPLSYHERACIGRALYHFGEMGNVTV